MAKSLSELGILKHQADQSQDTLANESKARVDEQLLNFVEFEYGLQDLIRLNFLSLSLNYEYCLRLMSFKSSPLGDFQ